MLPLGPTGYGDSPYQCFSAFAGNPLLISLDRLRRRRGCSSAADAATTRPAFPEREVDFGPVIDCKRRRCWRKAFAAFEKQADARAARAASTRFCARAARPGSTTSRCSWRSRTRTAAPPGTRGTAPLVARDAARARARPRASSPREIRERRVRAVAVLRAVGGACATQARAARRSRIIGDIPIFVAHDSADVWAHPELFHLDADGRPTVRGRRAARLLQRHRPAVGQPALPLGRARAQPATRWWIERLRAVLALVDLVRLDHFRGFEAYWEVPGDAPTADRGRAG